MKITRPLFFVDFKCSADRCTDSCCIGWEIDIDDITLEKYKQFKGKIKDELQINISADGGAHFILTKDERCPFLNNSNLCRLIIDCGESSLCDICREHPRFYEWYGKYKDEGLGLCCPEVCKLLFGSHEKLLFITEETEEPGETTSKFEVAEIETAREIRKKSLNIINNRKYSLVERIKQLLKFVYSSYHFESKTDYYKSVISAAKFTEPFDDNFIALVNSLEDNFVLIINKEEEFTKIPGFFESDYERLLSYLLFRWQIKELRVGEFLEYTEFCVGLLTFTYLTDLLCFSIHNNFTWEDRINNVKYISKQFEYSDINPQLFIKNISKQEKENGF